MRCFQVFRTKLTICFPYPGRSFKTSVQSKWFDSWPFLHYDEGRDVPDHLSSEEVIVNSVGNRFKTPSETILEGPGGAYTKTPLEARLRAPTKPYHFIFHGYGSDIAIDQASFSLQRNSSKTLVACSGLSCMKIKHYTSTVHILH